MSSSQVIAVKPNLFKKLLAGVFRLSIWHIDKILMLKHGMHGFFKTTVLLLYFNIILICLGTQFNTLVAHSNLQYAQRIWVQDLFGNGVFTLHFISYSYCYFKLTRTQKKRFYVSWPLRFISLCLALYACQSFSMVIVLLMGL